MKNHNPTSSHDELNKQRQHWESTFLKSAERFGTQLSDPARYAIEMFKNEGVASLLELGAGQGRDTLFFAEAGFQVHALDYSQKGIEAIAEKATVADLSFSITPIQHDVRMRLPFDDSTFDACYSHMLYCMALTRAELEFLSAEIARVLKPGGLNIYTVRHTGDPDYETGVYHGEDLYEVGGFIVHFFSREMVANLALGYETVGVDEFEEGQLPRRLFRVTLRKKN